MQSLPDEIIQQIVSYLPYQSVIAVEQTCHRIQGLIGPAVWRHLCRTNYQYWAPDRQILAKSARPVGDVDWRSLFIERVKLDREIDSRLHQILSEQHDRTRKVKWIVELGWDAKDALLRHTKAHDVDDILARQWYANATLACLHRSLAIDCWLALGGDDVCEVPLEDALGAFDLFVSSEPEKNHGRISIVLDNLKLDFLNHQTDFSAMDLAAQTVAIAQYVRQHDFVGIRDNIGAHYHDMKNNFIGHVLSQVPHSSLPLISVAIFCSLAQRLGVHARPCGFPFHVLAIVETGSDNAIFMDPFRSDRQVERSNLISQLTTMGAPPRDHESLLQPASSLEIVARCARNIITSFQSMTQEDNANNAEPRADLALYAALWALLVTARHRNEWSPLQETYLQVIVENTEAQYATDIWLMQKHFSPMFELAQAGVENILSRVRHRIDSRKLRKNRGPGATENVRYRVGQVFYHRRYQYYAIIVGWDAKCAASEQWIDQMRVDSLPQGREQSFYHVLVEDKSVRYVAEENINIVEQEPLSRLLLIAGQYFKRWDDSSKRFVSNIRDEYPDD